ncbi:MAG: hypothetical protein WBD07_09960 [Vicinamibacterales bacterium]
MALAAGGLVLAVALGGGALLAQAWQAPHAFISVFNGSGVPVSDLEPSQVSMTLDGAECRPIRLEPIEWPMKLAVLVDNGDASVDALPTIREGLRRFLFEVPDGIETSLLTLAPQPRWIVRPTAERQDFWRGVDRMVASGSTKLVEGLAEAADRIDKEKGDFFFTLLVITTNGAESSGGDLQRMFNRLREQVLKHPVTVHVLMLAISDRRTAQTAAGAPVAGAIGSATGNVADGGSVVSRPGLALKVMGALQSQIGLALTKDTGGRYESIAAPSTLLTLLPEYGQQIARSNFRQSHQYRVSCEQAGAKAPQMSVFTSYPGARSVAVTRDGRLP